MSMTEAQRKANKKYQSTLKQYKFELRKEKDKEIIEAFSQYCEENELSNGAALKKILIKVLVENDYLDSYYLL